VEFRASETFGPDSLSALGAVEPTSARHNTDPFGEILANSGKPSSNTPFELRMPHGNHQSELPTSSRRHEPRRIDHEVDTWFPISPGEAQRASDRQEPGD
jgi:hypothetical protein